LDHEDIAACLRDLLAQGDDVLLFFIQDPVHCLLVIDYDVVVQVCLGCGHAELDETDFRDSHFGRPPFVDVSLRVGKHHSILNPTVVNRATHLLHNLDIPQVHYVFINLQWQDTQHSIHCYRC